MAFILTIKQKYTLLFILGGLSALAPFSIDMYLPAFSHIAKDLNTDIAHITLSLTSYFIGIAVGQLIYGPITDKYGRKKPLIIGLSIFLLATIGCAFSPNINWLIGMRIILALGGCVGMVVSRAMVRDSFPIEDTAKIFSMLMLIVGIAPIIAPSIGSWLLVVSSWHAVFYFLAIFSLILILSVHFFLSESATINKDKVLSFSGAFQDYKTVFLDKNFLLYTLIGGVSMAGMFAYISGSPFVFIEYFGVSEQHYGWLFGFNALGFISGSQMNRFVLHKIKPLKVIATFSWVILGLSLLFIVLFFLHAITVPILVTLIFFFLFCLGIIVPNSTALALAPFSYNAGSASALIGFIQMVCGATFSGMVSALHTGNEFPMIISMAAAGIITFSIIRIVSKNATKAVLI